MVALSDASTLIDRRAEVCDLFWRFRGQIPVEAERTAKHALRDCDLFVAIGTSGTVAPASSFVRWAQLNGARSILLNLELFDGARELYGEHDTGPADELVPRWFG